ncbi:MAG: phage head closure protein [Minwuia sp.]|nr:phage head closure protein [Minwuia sp.]
MAGPRMQPGAMDQRIRIEGQGNTSDGQGGFTRAWSTVATVWARVEPITAKEAVEAGRIEFSQRFRIMLRTRLDFTTAARMVWTSNADMILNIREIHNGGPRPQFMMVIAESGVAT